MSTHSGVQNGFEPGHTVVVVVAATEVAVVDSVEGLTPWTWAFDWINLDDVSWQPITG